MYGYFCLYFTRKVHIFNKGYLVDLRHTFKGSDSRLMSPKSAIAPVTPHKRRRLLGVCSLFVFVVQNE